FSFAHAQAVVTLPSHASILTGTYPFQHGYRENSGYRLKPGVPTLATILKERGFATGAFVAAFPLDARFGLTPGFDVYDGRFDDLTGGGFTIVERPAAAGVALAPAWIDAQAGGRGRARGCARGAGVVGSLGPPSRSRTRPIGRPRRTIASMRTDPISAKWRR